MGTELILFATDWGIAPLHYGEVFAVKKDTSVFFLFKKCFLEIILNHSRTHKTCFSLGLECFGHIFSYYDSFESGTLWLFWWSPRPIDTPKGSFKWSIHCKSEPGQKNEFVDGTRCEICFDNHRLNFQKKMWFKKISKVGHKKKEGGRPRELSK